jgi:hypothetical protein
MENELVESFILWIKDDVVPSLSCQWSLKVCTTAVIFFKIYFAHESVHSSILPRKVAGKNRTGTRPACAPALCSCAHCCSFVTLLRSHTGANNCAFECVVSAVFLALKMEEEKPMKLTDVTAAYILLPYGTRRTPACHG